MYICEPARMRLVVGLTAIALLMLICSIAALAVQFSLVFLIAITALFVAYGIVLALLVRDTLRKAEAVMAAGSSDRVAYAAPPAPNRRAIEPKWAGLLVFGLLAVAAGVIFVTASAGGGARGAVLPPQSELEAQSRRALQASAAAGVSAAEVTIFVSLDNLYEPADIDVVFRSAGGAQTPSAVVGQSTYYVKPDTENSHTARLDIPLRSLRPGAYVVEVLADGSSLTSAPFVVPVSAEAPAAEPVSSGAARPEVYVVSSGDTVLQLAATWGTTIDAIARLNGLANPSLIVTGQTLRVPPR